MIRRIVSCFTLILGLSASAQAGFNVSNFQDVGLSSANSYFNATPNLTNPTFGSTTQINGQFVSGGNSFANSYSYVVGPGYTYNSWSGFAVSNQTLSAVTPYMNQAATPDYNYEYISATGSGSNGAGSPFAVATGGAIVNLATGSSPVSVQITNTPYDVYAIEHGDSFATAFAPGNVFNLTISGYTGLNGTGTALSNTVTVNLASDTAAGGLSILTSWLTVDLSSLAGAKSLAFSVLSNDNNQYGDAIPSMFDLDNLTSFTPSAVPEPSSLVLCLCGIGIGSLALRRVRSRKDLL